MNKLFKHQEEFLKLNPHKKILVWGTGSGKTRTSIEWADKNDSKSTLVIVPKALPKNWEREIKKWSKFPDKKWEIITKETFRKDWDKLKKFDCLIVEESHYFSGMKSLMSKALEKYIAKHKPEYMIGMTATPFMSSPWSVYRLSNLFGYNLNWMAFKLKFFYEIRMGRRMVPVMRKGMEEDVAALVKRMGNVVKLEDCIDVPESVYEVETLKLTKEQEKAMKEITDILPIVRFTRHHQVCGGTLKGNEYEESKHFKCDKLDRVLEIAQESKKLIVVSRYNEEGARIAEYLTENGIKSLQINGSVKNRDEVVQEFNNTKEAVLVVQAACSEGWEAPTCDTMVFYSYDFALKNLVQMRGRIQRINHIQKCKYISLVIADSIDEEIYDCVVNKKMDFQIKIYEN